jgi:anaerobic sulfite reductase subunit B
MSSLAEPAAAPMVPRRHRVRSRRRELADTVTLALDPLDGPALHPRPGQFVMLSAFGVGEAPVSASGDPTRPGPLVHTIRAVGAVSRALAASRPGDVLGVRGPFGTDWGLDMMRGGDVLIVAGGIGLAPLRPVVHALLARRERYGRIALLIGARTPETLLYARQLAAWRGRGDLHVEVTVDAAAPGWAGHVGVVTELVPAARFDPDRVTALVCGPEIMMRLTAKALVDRGVDPDRIRLSLERNMRCALGHCGHCQLGPVLVCRDGPVFSYRRVAPLLAVREL